MWRVKKLIKLKYMRVNCFGPDLWQDGTAESETCVTISYYVLYFSLQLCNLQTIYLPTS